MTWLADFFGAAYVRAIAAAVVVAIIAAAGWRVSAWRSGYLALEATESRLQALTAEAEQCAARERVAAQAWAEAAGKAKAQADQDRATAERVERELETKLAAADARGRDLARRLLDATRAASAGGVALSGAASAAGQPAGAAGEPGDEGGLGVALAAHLSACESDSLRLAGWQTWWASVQRP